MGDEKFSDALAAKMPAPQKSAYDAVVAEVRAADPDERLQVALAALHSLRNICIHPDVNGKRAASKISVIEDSGKMASVFKLLDNLKDKQEKCIVFLISKRAQQLLSAALEIRYGVQVDIVNGDTKTTSKNSDETRVGIIDRFQSAPGFGVIIMSPVAAGGSYRYSSEQRDSPRAALESGERGAGDGSCLSDWPRKTCECVFTDSDSPRDAIF